VLFHPLFYSGVVVIRDSKNDTRWPLQKQIDALAVLLPGSQEGTEAQLV
jgi:hypothetical protein